MEARVNEVLGQITESIAALQEVYPLDKNDLDAYVEAINDWSSVVPSILTAVNEGRVEEAVELIQNECTPRLNAMVALATEIDNKLTEAQDSAITREERVVRNCMLIVVGLLVVVGLFVIIFAIKIIRNITVPTEQVRVALVGFSEGNLSIPVEFESKNELGEMCDALRRSQTILGGVIADECDPVSYTHLAYEANLTALSLVKSLALKALEIGK